MFVCIEGMHSVSVPRSTGSSAPLERHLLLLIIAGTKLQSEIAQLKLCGAGGGRSIDRMNE